MNELVTQHSYQHRDERVDTSSITIENDTRLSKETFEHEGAQISDKNIGISR